MRLLRRSLILLAVLITTAFVGGYAFVRASLPALDGRVALTGLAAPVSVERDALGVPTLSAASREDLARATGYVHAQDRFFQMDLLRRLPAGELAALVGKAALPVDRRNRLHGLRAVAREVYQRARGRERTLLDAYAAGVNAGMAGLAARPPEYGVLRAEPEPWRPEDSVLVIFAMYLDLQDEYGEREAGLATLRRALPSELYQFLTAPGTSWDAPMDDSAVRRARVPGPEVLDLRQAQVETLPPRSLAAVEAYSEDVMPGSNSWAVGGTIGAQGAAWLANDMHLGHAVPNIWYRARFQWREGGASHDLTGVTLPGAPAMVVGSNGHIAWGFTNSNGDWVDRVLLEPHPQDPQRYRVGGEFRPIRRRLERLDVRGGESETLEVRSSVWGPLVPGPDGHDQALRWVAHLPEATDLHLMRLELAETLDEALDIANRSGVPAQNFIAVDRAGNLGWTLIGRIPRRQNHNPAIASSWADVGVGWAGWLAPEQYPRIVNPADARLWTANNRIVGGDALALLGDGGYALGARARQIRDGLRALEQPGPAELLALQLDDRALFLGRWRELLLEVLDDAALAEDPRRARLRDYVETWGGRASPQSVGYRIVRAYRAFVTDELLRTLTAPALELDADFRLPELRQAEGAVWALVTERPPHLLNPAYPDWRSQLLAVADRVGEHLSREPGGLAAATWGARNRLDMRHPLARALPAVLGDWLGMAPEPLAGDAHMPRVQAPAHGASERIVVSPGREAEGYFAMPGGQSGHPLSPFFRAGHSAWVGGEPQPFLPGPSRHRLELVPAPR